MKYCAFCGSSLDDDVIFCPKCGKLCRNVHATTDQPIFENNAHSIQEKQVIRQERKRKKAKQKRIVTAIVIGAVVLIVATFCIVAGSKRGESFFSSVKLFKKDATIVENVSDAADSILFLEVYDDEGNVTSTASGVVIHGGKEIATNYHVIEEAYKVIAYTKNKTRAFPVDHIIAYDEISDLALLRCEALDGIKSVSLADSDSVLQGDVVFAVGYPLGITNTMSEGIVSSRFYDENDVDTILITAAISQGSSGGALLNEAGQLIGITSASYIDGQNMNIAVASNTLMQLRNSQQENTLFTNLYAYNTAYGIDTEHVRDCAYAAQGNLAAYTLNGDVCLYDRASSDIKTLGRGDILNLYRNSVYFYSYDTWDIIKYDIKADAYTEYDLFPDEKYKNLDSRFFVFRILIAESIMYLDCEDLSDFSRSLIAISLLDSNVLFTVDSIIDFIYCGDGMYVALDEGDILQFPIGKTNIKNDSILLKTPCTAYFIGADNSGNVYFEDKNQVTIYRIDHNQKVRKFYEAKKTNAYVNCFIDDGQLYRIETPESMDKSTIYKISDNGSSTLWQKYDEPFTFSFLYDNRILVSVMPDRFIDLQTGDIKYGDVVVD